MPDESTPKDRLRKYKEDLARMAESEGRSLKLAEDTEESPVVPIDLPTQGPPKVLESPSKREMREATPLGRRSRRERDSGFAKDRMMLRARERAINSSLRDLKERKERLELVYKRKLISREEFERRKDELTEEGQNLLKEKAEVDRQLAQ